MLKDLFNLKNQVKIYVPSTINANEPVNNTPFVKAIAEKLAKMFGGATASDNIGYWLSDEKGLIEEKTTIVSAFCEESAIDQNETELVDIANWLKTEMTQESVLLEINGTAYFV